MSNTLNIAHNKRLFSRLVAGDLLVVSDIVLRSKQNDCNSIAIPSCAPTKCINALQEASKFAGLKSFVVNYKGITDTDIENALKTIEWRRKQELKKQNVNRNRGKSKNAKRFTLAEQKKRKAEKAAADRAYRNACKGASAKKD